MKQRSLSILLLVAVGLAGCGADSNTTSVSSTSVTSIPAPTSTDDVTGPATSDEPPEVVPGRAIVEFGDERLEFIVFQCLVGEVQTGSPYRRIALSASATEPFLDAVDLLNVNLLVSQRVTGHEEHVISIYLGDQHLGAADLALPSRGGPAPDDWIQYDEAAGIVWGSGFELADPGDPASGLRPPGTLVADCPES